MPAAIAAAAASEPVCARKSLRVPFPDIGMLLSSDAPVAVTRLCAAGLRSVTPVLEGRHAGRVEQIRVTGFHSKPTAHARQCASAKLVEGPLIPQEIKNVVRASDKPSRRKRLWAWI